MADNDISVRRVQTKTVIIGAGLAGISTAINLFNNNYTDFLVFEALDRIGGRCCTVDYGNSFLELGAQYIHGQVDNPIYNISRDHKQIDARYDRIMFAEEGDHNEDNNGICIDLSDLEDTNSDDKFIFTTQYGDRISLKKCYDLYNLVNKLIREAKDFYIDAANRILFEHDQSVGEYLHRRLNDLIADGYRPEFTNSLSDVEFRRLAEGFLLWRCKSENIEIGCSSVCDLSLKNYCLFRDLKGCQIMEPEYGYKSIINCMLKPFAAEFESRLCLNNPLKKILVCAYFKAGYNDRCSHCLYTSDKNKIVLLFSDQFVVCDNVVCTMSLGYLKENLDQLIEPDFLVTEERKAAVSRIGYGTVNKIFLEYEKPFWPQNFEGMFNLWLMDDNQKSLMDKTKNFTELNWFENISYFETVNNQDNLLSAWIAGCEFVEGLDDDIIARDCTILLRKRFNDEKIPMPKSVKRSSWWSNPYFRGSYSYMSLNSQSDDMTKIAEPIIVNNKAVIMFAGEATNHTQFSTAHAAYNTGIREASRILEEYNTDNKAK